LANAIFSLLAVFGDFRGGLQFPICICKQLLGFFRVATQLIFVLAFRFRNTLVGLDNVMLSRREISKPVGINILTGRLGNRYARTHQRSSQCTAQHYVFRFHDNDSSVEISEPCEFREARSFRHTITVPAGKELHEEWGLAPS
jgi:hypothetical protein